MNSPKERLVTPSKITAWLDCPHSLTLRGRVEDGQLAEPDRTFGSFARLLQQKGQLHEDECLRQYEADGKSVYHVSAKADKESFAAWVARVGNPMADGYDVIYQMPFVHDGVRGVADFLERVERPDGSIGYEPVDAKLTRADAKPGHVLQLCFYADAINARTGIAPEHMHILLGSKQRQSLRIYEFHPYWRRLRGQLATALEVGPGASTTAEQCAHCEFCEFFGVCDQQWRDDDSLIFIPGIRRGERDALDIGGVITLAGLAELDGDVAGIRPQRQHWLVRQAALQVQARLAGGTELPHELIEVGDDARLGHGFEQMPLPDDGDVFLDFEGHPFWRPNTGLFFLFGLIERDEKGTWAYRDWWAHNIEEEAEAVVALIGHLTERRRHYPGMHAYHYNHTERSALQNLTSKHGAGEAALGLLIQAEVFVDLLTVARNAIQVGAESYSLKVVERLTDYQRSHVIDKGAGAVVSYENFMANGDDTELQAIAAYNEDDVRATRALRDWLVAQRAADLPWREPTGEPDQVVIDITDMVARFHAFADGTPEHLLGDLLGYWTNEWWAYLMPKLAQSKQDTADLMGARDAIAAMSHVGEFPRFGVKGQELKHPAMRFSFPHQQFGDFGDDEARVLYTLPDGTWRAANIDRFDEEVLEIDLLWGEKQQEAGHLPESVILHKWVSGDDKRKALFDFAERLLENREPNPVTNALLCRELPRFRPGGAPPGGVFSDDLNEMCAWATQLDNSYVAVQGPPGTGKTYRAAHMVHALVKDGQRVGITAPNHRSIENVLREVIKVFTEKGDLELLNGVRVKTTGSQPELEGFTYGKADKAARPEFNVVAGTSWLFSNDKMIDARVDVLLIDEAGQFGLADALASSRGARNLILLGDPLQLPQVNQANHPGGGGRSALGHVLLDEVTLPADRGVFIEETRRMHPDICRFISDQIYEGRLGWHDDCENQTTATGTGLRWLHANHEGNSTSSVEEAQIIADQIAKLVGTPWTDSSGVVRPLTVTDLMVVAPYNDQVRTIRKVLNRNPLMEGVPVGTVDKFQGGTATVVFFSTATSTGTDIVRGVEFLFSRARLNVAISRARCLAYLVCTEGLLNTRARSVDEMRLIATLNAFVEWAV
ncbi:MAG: TM0106 family RecB-like putative nuclease [Mycobacterium sp.]